MVTCVSVADLARNFIYNAYVQSFASINRRDQMLKELHEQGFTRGQIEDVLAKIPFVCQVFIILYVIAES